MFGYMFNRKIIDVLEDKGFKPYIHLGTKEISVSNPVVEQELSLENTVKANRVCVKRGMLVTYVKVPLLEWEGDSRVATFTKRGEDLRHVVLLADLINHSPQPQGASA